MLKTAKLAARRAGGVLLNYFQKEIEVRKKGTSDLVTNVDSKAEQVVMEILRKKFPDHAFDCEESGITKGKSSKYMWVIDALDGTINFTRDLNPFCVSIGLLKSNEPFIGVIFDPIHNEMYYAQKGKGAYLNGRKISVSNTQIII